MQGKTPGRSSAHGTSPPIAVALKIEVQVQDAALKGAFEALFMRILPFLVQDLEGNILIRWACLEDEQACAAVLVCIGILNTDMPTVSGAHSCP